MSVILQYLQTAGRHLNRWPNLLFFVLLGLVFYFLKLFHYLPLEPQGMHFMRQTDGMAFLMGYYQFGNPFFEPRVYDLLGEGGKAASEFPIIYAIGAGLAKIFGPTMGIMRGLSLVFVSFGFWSLFQILLKESRHFFLSFAGALLPFTGVVFFYYAVGNVPDIYALGLSMLGWYFFHHFYGNDGKKYLYFSGLAFALAALIKITSLIHPISCFLAVLFFFPSSDIRAGWNRKQWIKGSGILLLFAALCAVIWVFYAKMYNLRYGNWYFLSKATPIWKMTREQISEQFVFMQAYWGESYFHLRIWKLMGFVALFNLYGTWRFRTLWNSLHWIILSGMIAYILLFYRQFADHDYYFLLCYTYFAFSLVALLVNIRELFPQRLVQALVVIILGFYTYIGLKQSESLLAGRFAHKDIFAAPCVPLTGYYKTLDSLGVPMEARFVILGDISVNGAQYFIRRQGYSVHDTSDGQFMIMKNHNLKHRYEYALSIDSLSFGPFIREWNMELLDSRPGIRLYKIGGEQETVY